MHRNRFALIVFSVFIVHQNHLIGFESVQETIVERDDAGRPRIERQVALDEAENFVNHGRTRVFNEAGKTIGSGQYVWGRRVGKWTRVYNSVNEASVLKQNAGRGFVAPFTSQTTFANGKIDGEWIIADKFGKLLIQWEFTAGERKGQWNWFTPSGDIRQQAKYENGRIIGDVISIQGKEDPKVLQRYIDGRRLVASVEKHPNGKLMHRGSVLEQTPATQVSVNWWKGTITETSSTPTGAADRHGEWESWYSNGHVQLTGSYRYGKEVGPFAWNHSNGQKQTEGTYDNAVRTGEWNEWYANGARKASGMYIDGKPIGVWLSWHDNGMRKQESDYGDKSELASVRTWDRQGRRVHEEEVQVADQEGKTVR